MNFIWCSENLERRVCDIRLGICPMNIYEIVGPIAIYLQFILGQLLKAAT